MRSLLEIGISTGTDKCSTHQYHLCYEKHFSALRDKGLSLLEIGVQEGASLKMWEEYFQRAHIFGVDVNASCKRYESERTKIMIGDQADRVFLRMAAQRTGPLDIVIDDGGHSMVQQMTSFEELFPFLRPGGIYVIEDLESSYDSKWGWGGGPVGMPGTTIAMLKALVDDCNVDSHHGLRRGPAGIQSICFYKNIVFVERIAA